MHRTTLAAVLLVMSFFAGSMGWPKNGFASEANQVRIGQMPGVRNDTCMGTLTLKRIDGVGEKMLCTTTTSSAGANFSAGSAKPLAFRLKHDPKFYEVINVCRGGGCVYAPHTDVLWEKRLDSGINFSLYRYDDFSQNLRSLREGGVGRWLYEYTGLPAQRAYSGINAFGISQNGQWIVAEIRNKGIILIASQNGTIRRVAPLLHQYWRGYDPTFHIAVQNDGKRLFLAGQNVSPALVDVTNGCGDAVVVGVSFGTTFSNGVTPCPIDIQSFAPTLPVYRYTHHPRFDDNTLLLMVRSMGGPDYLVEKRFLAMPEKRLAYIALGDSFTSGEGEVDDGYYLPGTNVPENRCHVSSRSYPFLLIKTPLPMSSVACSGAITDHLLEPNGPLPAQLAVVRRHQPEVVTTSVGGNDLDLVGKLAACAGPGTCVWAQPYRVSLTAHEANMLHGRLVDVFAEVREAAPLALHFIVGYPVAIDPNGSCDLVTSLLLNAEERRYLYEAQRLLNRVVASAAKEAHMKYVDVSNAFQNNALCSESTNPAMNGLRFGDDLAPIPGLRSAKIIGNESFHPTPFGHRLVADLVDASVEVGELVDCGAGFCEELSPDPYWGDISDDLLVYRLDHERLANNDVHLESTGLFKPGTMVAVSLFSEEVNLGEYTVDEQGVVQLSIDAIQLGHETHTVLLTGVNERGQEVVGYAIVRAHAVESKEVPQKISGIDVDGSVVLEGVPAELTVDTSARTIQPTGVGDETPQVLGTQANELDKGSPTEALDTAYGVNPWLAPIFATIGASLGIIALWLYFVRS